MSFIDDSFSPPRRIAFDRFVLDVLSPQYADVDYKAVTASADAIRYVFGPDNDWPSATISYEENERDLIRHAREFDDREAFAYVVLDATGKNYLGCLYLRAIKSKTGRDARQAKFSAQAFVWMSVMHDEVSKAHIIEVVSDWFASTWKLDAVAWPGHSPAWDEWKRLSETPTR
jgi:hypothetical protein